jgi:HemY protein
MKKNHAESSLAVARAALDAQDFALARSEAEAAIRMDRREGAYLLLADIEEAETGDEGKVRQLLAKAVRAPRDPAWVADGVVSERWQPLSPVTGRLDAFEWRAPMERVGQLIEGGGDDMARMHPALAAPGEKSIADGVNATPAKAAKPPPVETAGAAVPPEIPALASVADTTPPDILPPKVEEAIRLPDDPGVEPDGGEAEKAPRRFRLF